MKQFGLLFLIVLIIAILTGVILKTVGLENPAPIIGGAIGGTIGGVYYFIKKNSHMKD